MLSSIRKARTKKNIRLALIIMTVVLGIGLVGSFAIWSLPAPTQPKSGEKAEQDSAQEYEGLMKNIKGYKEMLKDNPDNVEVLKKLGNAYYDLGVRKLMEGQDIETAVDSLKQSLAAYERALELKPGDIELEIQAATAAFYTGDKEDAETHFRKALEIDPESVEARISYGQFLLYGKNDFKGAREQWQQAMDYAPDEATKQTLQALIKQAEELEQLQKQGEEEKDNG